ncbi:MAG: hypothetical protein EHM45_05610 [Desulfobacteraceae bacterium]|nr:MAG: hypothetical protein EHM45_05610 [Desulfobacteraceae bacterium]
MNTETVIHRKAQHSILDYFSQSRDLIRSQYWLFLGLTVVGILLGSLAPLGILMGPMMCGIFLCFLKKECNEELKFEHLFKGFDYFLESFLVTLIYLAFMLAAALPLTVFLILNIGGLVYAFQQEDPSLKFIAVGVLTLLVLLSLFLFCFIAVPMQFSFLLIVERKCKAWDAVKTAFKACWANFLKMTGMGVAVMAFSFAGMCCCYIGVLFLQPLIFGAYFAAYRDMFEQPTPPPMPGLQA